MFLSLPLSLLSLSLSLSLYFLVYNNNTESDYFLIKSEEEEVGVQKNLGFKFFDEIRNKNFCIKFNQKYSNLNVFVSKEMPRRQLLMTSHS